MRTHRKTKAYRLYSISFVAAIVVVRDRRLQHTTVSNQAPYRQCLNPFQLNSPLVTEYSTIVNCSMLKSKKRNRTESYNHVGPSIIIKHTRMTLFICRILKRWTAPADA